MTDIRPFERSDVEGVLALLAARLPWWTHDESFLEQTLIDSPWADPGLPSLVAVDDGGGILGFIGSQVRRLKLDDRELRGICCAHLVVAADRRAGPAGALLLRRLLSGDQDLTWTDSPTEGVVRMWRAFGGNLDHPRSCDWMLVLRPFQWARGVLTARTRHVAVREVVPVAALPAQASGGRFVPRAFPNLPPEVSGEDAPAATIVEHLPLLTRGLRLRVDYDQPYLEQLFARVEASMGPLVHRLVRRDGAPVGWYAYLSRPGGASRVLHVCAPEAEVEAVVGELAEHARAQGSGALAGRLEPHLEGPLRRRLAVIGFARQPVIHVHDPEVHALLSTSSSLLTHLDGEWYVI
ncbi:MAG: hypothetical protein ACRDMH_10005 [Solirubrobacterales bacterium]